jgi:hypothetical protein
MRDLQVWGPREAAARRPRQTSAPHVFAPFLDAARNPMTARCPRARPRISDVFARGKKLRAQSSIGARELWRPRRVAILGSAELTIFPCGSGGASTRAAPAGPVGARSPPSPCSHAAGAAQANVARCNGQRRAARGRRRRRRSAPIRRGREGRKANTSVSRSASTTKPSAARIARLESSARLMRLHPALRQPRWAAIHGRRLGASFRRQAPGGSVPRGLPRCCGAAHRRSGARHSDGHHEADARRERGLRPSGYRVLHLPAALVLGDPKIALAIVSAPPGRMKSIETSVARARSEESKELCGQPLAAFSCTRR